MAEDEWDDINEHVEAEWKAETTPFERIHEVVETIDEGQSAAEIADRALVSEPTARRHLDALVNTGFATTEREGRTTLYKRDADHQLMRRVREVRETTSRDDLLERIEVMKRDLREYEERYDAASPGELARQLDGDDDGWADLADWRTTRRNLAVAQAALAYGKASDLVEA